MRINDFGVYPPDPITSTPVAGVPIYQAALNAWVLPVTDANCLPGQPAQDWGHPQFSTRGSASSPEDQYGNHWISVGGSYYVVVNVDGPQPKLVQPVTPIPPLPGLPGNQWNYVWSGLEAGVLYGFCITMVMYKVDLTANPVTFTQVADFAPYVPRSSKYIDNTGHPQPTTLSFIGFSKNDNRAYIGYSFTDWGESTQPNGQPKGAPFFVFDITKGEIIWTLSSYDPHGYYKPNSDRIVSRVDSGYVGTYGQPAPTSTYFADLDAVVQWQNPQTESVSHPVDELDSTEQHGAEGVDMLIQGGGFISPDAEGGGTQFVVRRDFADWHRVWTISATDRFGAPNTFGIPNGLYFSLTGGDQRWCTQTVISQIGYAYPGDGEIADFDSAGNSSYRRYCHHNGNLTGQYTNRGLANKSITNKLIVFSSEWIQTKQDSGHEYHVNVYVVATGLQPGDYHEESPIDAPAYADQKPVGTPWPRTSGQPENANLTAITIPASMLKTGQNLVEIMVQFAPYGYGPQPGGLLIECNNGDLATPGLWQIRDPQSAATTWMPPGGTLVPATVCTTGIPSVWYVSKVGAKWIGPYANPYGPTGKGQSSQPVYSCSFNIGTPVDITLNSAVCTWVVRIAVNNVTMRQPSAVATLPEFQHQAITIGVLGPDLSWPDDPHPNASRLRAAVCIPEVVSPGDTVTFSVAISPAAPAGGYAIALTSSNPNIGQIPASITVPAGASSASVSFSAGQVTTPTFTMITATANGVTVRAYVYVEV